MADDSGETDTEGYQYAVFSTEFALARLWIFLWIRLVLVVRGDITLASDLQFFDRDSLMRLELSVELAGAFPIIGDIERSILKRCNNTLDIVNMISSGNSIFPTNVTDEESFYTSQSSKFFLFNFSSGCRIENSRSVLDVGWKILA